MYSPRRLFVFGIILIVLSCLVLVRYERILGSLQPQTVPYFHDRDFMPGTHRSGAISHHDARFMPPWEHQVSVEERHGSLVGLIHSFTQFMEDKGMQSETWLAHGTLLGWFWNAKILPWDTDVDFHLTLDAMHVLAKSYNMTVYTYRDPLRQPVKTNDYLLDINYHYVDASSDVANKIDGRWIDMTNGKFIDITVVRPGKNRSILSCKDGHTYKVYLSIMRS